MAKKTFSDINNPALSFISDSTDKKQELSQKIQNIPVKVNPLYIETKSKRVNLLMQPSLHKKIATLAKLENKSLNDLVHSILEEYTGNH